MKISVTGCERLKRQEQIGGGIEPTPPLPKHGRFELVLDGEAVHDRVTGLIWERDPTNPRSIPNTPIRPPLVFDDAVGFCNGLEITGKTGWRLPTITEFVAIFDYGRFSPALPENHLFTEKLPGAAYWSSTDFQPDDLWAWSVFLSGGAVNPFIKSEAFLVWAVLDHDDEEKNSIKAIDLIRFALESSKAMTVELIEDMKDAPLTQPTPNGGNHPTWIAGHLAYSEARLTSEVMFGKPNPLVEYKEMFQGGSQPTTDKCHYPKLEELLMKWEEVRANTRAILDSLSDEDLGKATAAPDQFEEVLGTYGKLLTVVALHTMNCRGQVADARVAAGLEPLVE